MSHGFWSLVFGRLDVEFARLSESVLSPKSERHHPVRCVLGRDRRRHRHRGAADPVPALGSHVVEMADQRRSQADRRDVYCARPDHAGARSSGGRGDARPASRRTAWRIPFRRPLRPALFDTRHDHDLFHGYAISNRVDQHRGTAADRRTGCQLSDAEFAQPRPDCLRGHAGDDLARHRGFLDRRLERLPALHRAQFPARRWA